MKKYPFLVMSCLLVSTLSALTAQDSLLYAKLRGAVTSMQNLRGIQGVSASVVYNNALYTMCSGESFVGTPITDDMVFAIGSNTKTMTALVLLRLQEEAVLDLDDAVAFYLPRHPHIDSTITVRQLLNHTSGLGDYSTAAAYREAILANPRRLWRRDELFELIPPQSAAPGTTWSYCNTNYLIAGAVAEQASGKPLAELYSEYISRPYDLDSIRLFPQDSIIGELAHRWMNSRDASAMPMIAEWSGAWAAGAVISSARQYAALYDKLFRGFLLTPKSMEEFTTFVEPNSYGLGIRQLMLGGRIVYGHGGEIRGYTSSALWVPSLRAAVVVLTNEAQGSSAAVADTIVRVLASHITSVEELSPQALTLPFPARVFSLTGELVAIPQSYAELCTIPPQVYYLSLANGRHVFASVLPTREVAILSRTVMISE